MRLFELPQQPVDILQFDFRPRAVAGPPPQLVPDFPCAFQVTGIRNDDIALGLARGRVVGRAAEGVLVARIGSLAGRLLSLTVCATGASV